MNRLPLVSFLVVVSLLASKSALSQTPETKFIADTLVVQADGTYQTDPDLATVIFDISVQDKELKQTYDQAASAMQKSSTSRRSTA